MKITETQLKKLIKDTIIDLTINEGFKEKGAQFVNQGADPEDVKKTFTTFKMLKDKNMLKGEVKNIDNFRTFEELENFLRSMEDKESKTESSKDITILRDDENMKVFIPHSYEASCKGGATTNWCISTQNSRANWDRYADQDVKIIMMFDKNASDNDNRFALAIYKHAEDTKPQMEAFDQGPQGHNSIKPSIVITRFNLKPEWLQNIFVADMNWFKRKFGNKMTKNSDGSVNINGSIDISGQNLADLPFGVW